MQSDPDEDPHALLLFSAQKGLIPTMELAVKRSPQILFASDIYMKRSALHHAAASPFPTATNSVRWLLQKGVPWSATDQEGHLAEDLANMCGNEESRKILREWAIQKGERIRIGLYVIRIN